VSDDVRPVEPDMIEQSGAHGGIVVDAERATIERDVAAIAQHRILGQDVDQRWVPAHEWPGVQQDDSVTAAGHRVVDGDTVELDVSITTYLPIRLGRWARLDRVGALPPECCDPGFGAVWHRCALPLSG
jgi:hypothetical protein